MDPIERMLDGLGRIARAYYVSIPDDVARDLLAARRQHAAAVALSDCLNNYLVAKHNGKDYGPEFTALLKAQNAFEQASKGNKPNEEEKHERQ